MHILFLPTYLGGTFSSLLEISVSEWNFFSQVGGGGAHAPSAPPPAYAPAIIVYSVANYRPHLSSQRSWRFSHKWRGGKNSRVGEEEKKGNTSRQTAVRREKC